jgi:hypothetical protein
MIGSISSDDDAAARETESLEIVVLDIEEQEHGRKSEGRDRGRGSRGERSKARPHKKRERLASNASTEANNKLAVFLW